MVIFSKSASHVDLSASAKVKITELIQVVKIPGQKRFPMTHNLRQKSEHFCFARYAHAIARSVGLGRSGRATFALLSCQLFSMAWQPPQYT